MNNIDTSETKKNCQNDNINVSSEIVAGVFFNQYIRQARNGYVNDSYWFEKLNLMNPEHREMVAKIVTEKISHEIEVNKNNESYMEYLLPRAIKFYNEVSENDKKYMRSVLLKWRTSGDNSERRNKAALFKKSLEYLKKGNDNIKKDETIKAISGLSFRKGSLLNKLNAQNIELSFEMEKDVKLREKAQKISADAEQIKEAFDEYGVNKPFVWERGALIKGCESWWRTLKTDGHGGERREAVEPLYVFRSKDIIELVGAEIYEYDRMHTNVGGMSGNRHKVREISADEYKQLLHKREIKRQELNKGSSSASR